VPGENPQRTLVVFHQWRYLSGANRDRIVAKRQQYEDVLTRIVDEGVATGAFSPQLDERIAVLSILGSLNWTVEWFRPGGAALPAEVADRLADAVLCGLVRG